MKHVILVHFKGEVTVGTLIYDNPCRGDIPRYNEAVFASIEKATKMYPKIVDPITWCLDPQHNRITSWEAVEYLNRSHRFALNNCRFIHGDMADCTWPRCFFQCLKPYRVIKNED
jgi:hypothetical protein